MATKKLTRKELLREPDEFITTTGRLIALGVAYRKQLLIGATVFLAAVLLFTILRVMSLRSENQSFVALSKVMAKYEAQEADKSDADRLQAVKADFEEFLGRYGDRGAGRIGRVIFAGICRDGGDLDTAVSLFTRAIDDYSKNPFYANLIHTALGQRLTAKKETAQAVTHFEAAAVKTASPLADTALFNLGLLAEAEGQAEKARSYFKRISEDYPDSIFRDIVKERTAG